MPKLLIKANSTNEEWSGDCDCAVLNLMPGYLARVEQRCKAAAAAHAADESLYEMIFWGSPVEFYGSELETAVEDAGLADDYHDCGHVVLPANFEFTDDDGDALEPSRTECNQTIIRCDRRSNGELDFDLAFFCYPKHGDVHIQTYAISLTQLRELLAETTVRA